MNEIIKILIVEDSEDDVILMTHYIKQKCINMEYTWVDSKSKLISQLESDINWDLAICDNNLPQLTGSDAVSLIAEKSHNIPVICVSGSAIDGSYNNCLKAGAIAFVEKKNLEELVEVVIEILAKK